MLTSWSIMAIKKKEQKRPRQRALGQSPVIILDGDEEDDATTGDTNRSRDVLEVVGDGDDARRLGEVPQSSSPEAHHRVGTQS